MRTLTKKVGIEVYDFNELNGEDQDLFIRATKIRQNAQAPYSRYKVGCAILAESVSARISNIYLGINHETNSYSQTTHAEQSAISNAITALGPVRIIKVAVVGAPEDQEIVFTPPDKDFIGDTGQVCPSCGHCLQIILENSFDSSGEYNPDVILMGTRNGEFYITTIGEALPMPFLPQYLGTNYVEIARKAGKL